MVVELQCVSEKSKVRVRIVAYIDAADKRYENVYNNNWNCRFPKALREIGKRFLVPDANVKLCHSKNGVYYYSISTSGISEITPEPVTVAVVYEVSTECVICLSAPSLYVFAPCGHFCACQCCGDKIKICCICRANIQNRIFVET